MPYLRKFRLDKSKWYENSKSRIKCQQNLFCNAGHNFCAIDPYGNVYPCLQLPIPVGNLRYNKFKEICSY